MRDEQAEDLLNNSDLRKRSYTENQALINYQLKEIRRNQEKYLEHQRRVNTRLGGAIEGMDERMDDCEKDIIILRERQAWWNRGLAVLGALAAGLGLRR